MTRPDLRHVDDAVERLGREPEACIPILQALQDHYHYLPVEALERVCELTRITPAQIAGVSSFYTQFRHRPRGQHLIRVCHGTACHVRGSERVHEALNSHLKIDAAAGADTSPDGQYTVEPVACVGCCTLAPVVVVDGLTYGHVTSGGAGGVAEMLRDFAQAGHRHALDYDHEHECAGANGGAAPHAATVPELRVGLGSCCMAKGSGRVFEALNRAVRANGMEVSVQRVGCVGACHRTPMVELRLPGRAPLLYEGLHADAAPDLLRRHFRPHGLWPRLRRLVDDTLDRMVGGDGQDPVVRHEIAPRDPALSAFLGPQVRIATESFGEIDPLDLDQYRAAGGFRALEQCLQREPLGVIEAVKASGLRGRGGAGFPTGLKWERMRASASADGLKYVICNGDEGDPGAFMDRMLLESFPYRIIEGLAIAAYAVGAREGHFYIRAEYPLAVRRVRKALAVCEERGLLGGDILGSGFGLKLSIKEGAGAFVCGEETALIASVEGQRGMPRLRPPYPAESGLWGRPTLINNVETLAMVPWIIRHPGRFEQYGTASSKGTKVFALAGKVKRGGLIEVPMGITLRQIVEEIGGGAPLPGSGPLALGPSSFKAVQIGGPSGGCIPAELADTPVDYEALGRLGAIMGSGGLVVLDQHDCMVDIARYFLSFTQDQSCGKCTFCRVGTRRMLDILNRICAGQGKQEDLAELEHLAQQVQAGSLCGLGKTAPNPVLTTLQYFRHEYEAHLAGRCPAGKCKALIRYRVTEACIGCTICAQQCPADAIPYAPYRRHWIDMDKCTRCDTCRVVCPVAGAVVVE